MIIHLRADEYILPTFYYHFWKARCFPEKFGWVSLQEVLRTKESVLNFVTHGVRVTRTGSCTRTHIKITRKLELGGDCKGARAG